MAFAVSCKQPSWSLSERSRFSRPILASKTSFRVSLPKRNATSEATNEAVSQEIQKEVAFEPLSGYERFWTSVRLIFALPWRRFKKGSILSLDFSEEIREVLPPQFSSTLSLPTICEVLHKAAVDPRIAGIYSKIEPMDCGWAKLTEIRRHIESFNASGKFSVAYLEFGGEKEYYLASAFKEIYVPPSANFYLRGLMVSGTFLRGALDKAGLEPQVKRIGNYKSAGDQLLREEMSEYQREALEAILEDIYSVFSKEIAQSRDLSVESVEKALNDAYIPMEAYVEAGLFTGLKYKDEIKEMLKERLGIKKKNEKLKRVSFRKYKSVSPSAFALNRGKKAIAIIRASGAISRTSLATGAGSIIKPKEVIRDLRRAVEMKNVAAIVLRIDSPGGEALSSDLLWREIQMACKEKPVIASMSDVAGSGGYYMAMGAQKIVAEDLTLTGSIGVVLTKIGLAELYKKLGINKENLSKGRFAEIFVDNRSFTEDEDAYFSEIAEYAYTSFRDKAALSRGVDPEEMQKVAQGRVWTGTRAVNVGLVDAIGGIHRAIAIARESANLKNDVSVRIIEISRGKGTPFDMLKGAGLVMNVVVSALFLGWGVLSSFISKDAFGFVNAVISMALGSLGLYAAIPQSDDPQWEYTMDDIQSSSPQSQLPYAIMDLDGLTTNLKPALMKLLEKLL